MRALGGRIAFVAGLACALLGTPSFAHDVGPLRDQDVAGAVYRATAFNRTIEECASLFGERSRRRQEACDAAREAYREGFRVAVEACNEGGQVPELNVEIPVSYTCTIAVQEKPGAPVRGRAAIIYNAAGVWNAILL